MKSHLIAIVALSCTACTYGVITDHGAPIAGAEVIFETCKEQWKTTTNEQGQYVFNPYDDDGVLVDSTQYIDEGTKFMVVHRGGATVYADWVEVTHAAKCKTRPLDPFSPRVPCQEVSVEVSGQSVLTRILKLNAFTASCIIGNQK